MEPLLLQQEQVVLVAVEQVAFAVLVAEVESASLVAVLLVHRSRPVG